MQQNLSSFLGSASNATDDVSVDNSSVSQDCCPNGCSLVFIMLWVLPQNREGETIFWFKGKEKKNFVDWAQKNENSGNISISWY